MKQPIRYRLPVAKTFPAHHPRKGEETGFWHKIHNALYRWPFDPHKIHTIRKNYDLWEKRFKKIDAGEAVLEVYEDTEEGKKNPITLSREDGIGLQELFFVAGDINFPLIKFGREAGYKEIARNDGLSDDEFFDWFDTRDCDLDESFALIHFTKFRY